MITSPKPTGKELWKAFVDAIWALLMPVIILGGIYGGYFTPTEAAAVAVVYGLIIGLFVYRELKWKDIPKTFVNAARTSAAVMMIIVTAGQEDFISKTIWKFFYLVFPEMPTFS